MARARDRFSPPRWAPVLLLSIVVCLWQFSFFRDATRLLTHFREGSAVGVCDDIQQLFYFFYYFNQFPVMAIEVDELRYPFSQTAARLFVDLHGDRLIMDSGRPCNTARYGDLGKIFLVWPAALWRGSPENPTFVPTSALLFVAGLLAVLVGFWRARQPALGLLIVLLVGSNPFQLYETYRHENVFSLPISAALLLLGSHVRWMSGASPLDPRAFATAALTGAFLATLREVRTDSALMGLSAVGIYLTVPRSAWRRKLALVAVFGASAWLTAQAWTGYFDSKFTEAQEFVRRAGGHPYTGPRSQHHPAWHNVFLGLGDFDTKFGYRWDDKLAYAYATPILRSQYKLSFTYDGTFYFRETYGGPSGLYRISPQDLPEYVEVIRAKVIRDIVRDPAWYLGILWQRIRTILSQTTPISVALGDSRLGVPFSGWFFVPTLLALAITREAFLAKLLLFSFPLSLTPLLVFCGPGATYYAIFHILTLCVWVHLLLDVLRRRRPSGVATGPEAPAP